MFETIGNFTGGEWQLTQPVFPNEQYGFNGRHFSVVTNLVSLVLEINKRGPLLSNIYPPANEVWGKVVFLQVSVILSTGGVCLGACWEIPSPRRPPPGNPPTRETPYQGGPPAKEAPLPGRHPPTKETPPIFFFIFFPFFPFFLIFFIFFHFFLFLFFPSFFQNV